MNTQGRCVTCSRYGRLGRVHPKPLCDTCAKRENRGLPPTDGLPSVDYQPTGWKDDATCAQIHDPELWFPQKGGNHAAAKTVCTDCPVTLECLTYALTNGEQYGVWGGLSPDERQELARGAA